MKRRIPLLALLALPVLLGCPEEDASSALDAVLSRCAATDAVRNVLFLGFSNTIGPGTIWRSSAENGYLPVRPMPDFEGKEQIFNVGASNRCRGEAVRITDLGVDLGGRLGPLLPAEAGIGLSSADDIEVTTGDWRWDELWVGRFADWVGQLPEDHSYRRSLEQDSLVAGRAIRVQGYQARLTFTDDVDAAVRARLPGRLTDAGLEGRWADARTLEVGSDEPVYVAVQMYRWDPARGLSSGEALSEVPLEEDARVVPGPMTGGTP